jgi:hypothetical protein
LPGLVGFALLLSEILGEMKLRRYLSLVVPLVFVGFVTAYHLPDSSFYKSQYVLVKTYQEKSVEGQKLVYLGYRPDSAQFYLQGATITLPLEMLNEQANSHDFFVVRSNDVSKIPTEVLSKLESVKTYGRFMMFQGKGINP